MARQLDDIFNECYERIRSGESLESCLRSYPQYRVQLEPLLRTTFDIGRRISYIHPRPEFKHWAQVRIESVQRYPRRPTMAEAPVASTWLRHGWAIIVSVGIVLLLTTGSTMAASSQALPDQTLYPVKLATEEVQRALTVTPERKAQLETDIANIRAVELEAMANAGKTQAAAEAAVRYSDQFERAVQAIVAAGGTDTESAAYVPPTVTTPVVVTPPPTTSTPTTSTTTPETTPPEVSPPPVIPASENTTPLITPPAETTTVTDNIAPPEITTPSETTTPPETTIPAESTTPAETATTTTSANDNSKAARVETQKQALRSSAYKSWSALKNAQDKASQDSKVDWQKAINVVNKYPQISTSDNNTSTNSGSSSYSQPSSSKSHNYGR
jgi:Domain of unknown function (DUF5667)